MKKTFADDRPSTQPPDREKYHTNKIGADVEQEWADMPVPTAEKGFDVLPMPKSDQGPALPPERPMTNWNSTRPKAPNAAR